MSILFLQLMGVSAQKRKREISGQNNTYYCGAYWHNGFHEDGVVSALDVCSQFGESLCQLCPKKFTYIQE